MANYDEKDLAQFTELEGRSVSVQETNNGELVASTVGQPASEVLSNNFETFKDNHWLKSGAVLCYVPASMRTSEAGKLQNTKGAQIRELCYVSVENGVLKRNGRWIFALQKAAQGAKGSAEW